MSVHDDLVHDIVWYITTSYMHLTLCWSDRSLFYRPESPSRKTDIMWVHDDLVHDIALFYRL